MSAIFGETLTFAQADGSEVRLVAYGDESYAWYQTLAGYTAIYDGDRGKFCYAAVANGQFVSTGVPVTDAPPAGLPRGLHEAPQVRQLRHVSRRVERRAPPVLEPNGNGD